MFADKKINLFLQEVSNKSPLVPTSGSVVALSAASSAALVAFVANVTLGKKGYEDVEEEMQRIYNKALKLKKDFMQAIDEDAAAFTLVLEALKLPKLIAQDLAKRNKALQYAFEKATLTPLDLAEKACDLMEEIKTLAEKGNKNALGDVVTAANLGKAAILSSLYNAKENLKSISDSQKIEDLQYKIREIESRLEEIEKMTKELYI